MEHSKPEQDLNSSNNNPLDKLISFIEYHQVSHQELWGAQPSINVLQFAEALEQKYGYKMSQKQIIGLRNIAQKKQNLYVQNFHPFGIWKNVSYQIHNKLNRKAEPQKIRPQTAAQFQFSRLSKSPEYSKPAQSNVTYKIPRSPTEELFKNSRYKQAQDVLENKIVQNALDKKWEYVIKVGEMNTWAKNFKSVEKVNTFQNFTKEILNQITQSALKKTSRVYKIQGDNQNIQIIEEKQNGIAEVLPLKVFDQKYQSMKKKCTVEEKMKNNMKGTMLLVLDKKQKVSKAKLGQKISQRDQQLNYLLLQVMRLRNIFEQQQQILSECGVNC